MKILIAGLLAFLSPLAKAYTPVTPVIESWNQKGIPIVVYDSLDYFYSHRACPPEVLLLPNTVCGKELGPDLLTQETYTPPLSP